MADVLMPTAPVPSDENVAPSNVAPCNPLLAGACDDNDNELTDEQKKIIEDRLKALQARFKAFEEKTLKQKVDELILANEGLTEKEAEMSLRVCNGNEFEASDRLTNEEEGNFFLRKIRRFVLEEARAAKLSARARKKVEERLAKKRKRLARRHDDYDVDEEEASDWEESDWDDDDDEALDQPMREDVVEEDADPVQEVRFGVKFVRHNKKHKVGGRLKLDDALAQLAAAQQAAEAAKKVAADAAATPNAGESSEDPASDDGAATTGGETSGGENASPEAAPAPAPAAAAAAAAAPPAFNLDDLMEGWSDARKKAWNNREKNENQYYYRFNAPGEAQGEGKWKDHEHELFMETLKKVRDGSAGYPMYQWGSFSKNIPGRVGYQCSNYYRTLIKSGEVEDSNYMTDEKGELRFNFKNKGFERKNKDTGVSEIVTIKPRKPKPPPKPKPVKVPKPPKPKKEKKPKKPKPTQEEREDKDFRCSAKFETTRRSGRNAGKEKKYTEDGEEEEEEEAPVLPGFVDPLTKMQVEEPAISPYGHVAGYETWCRILRQEDTKDTCPFTRQPLKRRELVKLTHENIAEYREKMVDTQQ